MSAPTYRAAIIGTGRIASLLERDPLRSKPHTHAGWYAACPRTTLVAGCDLDAGRLATFGNDWHVPADHLFTDYREMLDRVRPDIVSICGYAPERRAMIEASVAAGARGLWVEKAIACSVPEIEAIEACANRAGVSVVVDQPRRGDARYLAVRDAIASGELGALESVHCLFSGHFVHTGVHAWDVLRLWLGEWQRAAAWLDGDEPDDAAGDARPGADADDDGSVGHLETLIPSGALRDRGGQAHVEFPDGVHVFVSGGLKRYFMFQFDLIFERGRIRLGNEVDERQGTAPSPRYSGFIELAPPRPLAVEGASRPMVDDLVHAMDTGARPWMSLEDAGASMRLALALFQSECEGHRAVTPGALSRDLYVASI